MKSDERVAHRIATDLLSDILFIFVLSRFCFVILLGTVMFPVSLSGQGLFEEALTASDDIAVEEKENPVKLDLYGFIRSALFVGRKEGDTRETEMKSGYAELRCKLKVVREHIGDAFADMRFSSSFSETDRHDEITLREGYCNLYPGDFDIRFGHQIIPWGRADILNPTDNLTPWDLRIRATDYDDRRSGNFALRIHYNFYSSRFEFVGIPAYSPSYFPEFKVPEFIAFAEADYPEHILSNVSWAMKLEHFTSLGDFSLSYFDGYALFPGIDLLSVDTSSFIPQVTVRYQAYHKEVYGGDWTFVLPHQWSLRGEIAYVKTELYDINKAVPNPSLTTVVEAEREFFTNFTCTVHYSYLHVYAWKELPNTSVNQSIDELLDDEVELLNRIISGQSERGIHRLGCRFTYMFMQERFECELLGLYNISTDEYFLRPRCTFLFTDEFSISSGAEIFRGPDDTLNSLIEDHMNAAYIELKVYF